MNKDIIYNKIKVIFNNSTPLKSDCGVLCDRACCKGSENQGMILFPEEKTKLNVIKSGNYSLAVCNGTCSREDRPVSCMLFPFFPIIDGKGKIHTELDYRGYGICPMIKNAEIIKFNRKFLKNIEKAGKLLYTDDDIRLFMYSISDDILKNKSDILKFGMK